MSRTEVQQITSIIKALQNGEIPADAAFDACMPNAVRRHTSTHFTPLEVVKEAAQFLCGGDRGWVSFV